MLKLFATDLDGTLLRDDKTISREDWGALKKLGEKKVVRVAATGRSMFKVKQVLPLHAPIDYVVFSSGAGVYDWRKQSLLQSERFDRESINSICGHLIIEGYNFFLFKPIPNNNLFYYHQGAGTCPEFEQYMQRHEGDYDLLDIESFPLEGGQFLVVIPNSEILFRKLESEIYDNCKGIRIIRATSPVDDGFIWLEIFPETVSKGHGIEWICENLKISRNETVGAGNDFNDIGMFEFVGKAFLVANGPESLKQKYHAIEMTNNQSAVNRIIQTLVTT